MSLYNTQNGAGLQLNYQLWQSPSPFRLHPTAYQSNPVIALLWRADAWTGLCLAPSESEARWDTVNGYISASHTRRLLLKVSVARVVPSLWWVFLHVSSEMSDCQQKDNGDWEEIVSNLHALPEKSCELKWNLHPPRVGRRCFSRVCLIDSL